MQLCRDCLFIVYQFAADAKAAGAASISSQAATLQDADTRYVIQRKREEENISPAFCEGTWDERETLKGTWGMIRASPFFLHVFLNN